MLKGDETALHEDGFGIGGDMGKEIIDTYFNRNAKKVSRFS